MRARTYALLLIAPLVLFLMMAYFIPLANMVLRSFYDPVVADILPDTVASLQSWDGVSLLDEAVFIVAARELTQASKDRTLGRAVRSINRVQPGARSLLIRTARKLRSAPPEGSMRDAMINIHVGWSKPATWHAIRQAGKRFTWRYYLNAVDLTQSPTGEIVMQPEEKRIYITLAVRTLAVSLAVTILCLVLGYPLAYLIANIKKSHGNILLLLVLLPFWTSLLVRTTSWIVLLQQQGVINDLLVAIGLIDDTGRLAMVYNMTGTLVAMTHILLPFMVLPLYSVMRAIPPVHMRAAASLGAGFSQSFRQVYWPQSVPGVGAGCLLVFILSIGYYITPALVGGQSGQLISNLIAFHIQQSLNWGLAAALGTLLLVSIKLLYVLYSRISTTNGIKLG